MPLQSTTTNPPTPCPSPDASREQTATTHTHIPTHEWATFTYIGKETTFITNLFRKTNKKFTFRTKNSIQNLLMHKQQTSDIYSRSGVYKLTCPDCGKGYVGQTCRSFTTRFREHKIHVAFRTASRSSYFAKHLIDHTHSFGPIHNIMQILELQNKGAHLNTLERFHIYTEYTSNNHLNDEVTISPNKIFDTLVKPHQS